MLSMIGFPNDPCRATPNTRHKGWGEIVDGGATKMAALTITGRNQQNSFRSREKEKTHGSQRAIEDDGKVTGADYFEDRLRVLKAAAQTDVRLPLLSRIKQCLGGLTKAEGPRKVQIVLEQMVLAYLAKHGSIKRADVADLCRTSPFQATRLLKRLAQEDKITPKGKGKGTIYEQRS